MPLSGFFQVSLSGDLEKLPGLGSVNMAFALKILSYDTVPNCKIVQSRAMILEMD